MSYIKESENTVQKSVRLPYDLVEYVELQEGKNFSAKLINLLDDVCNGDVKRRQAIAEYDSLIDDRRQKLQEITHNIYNATLVMRKIEQFNSSMESLIGTEPNKC